MRRSTTAPKLAADHDVKIFVGGTQAVSTDFTSVLGKALPVDVIKFDVSGNDASGANQSSLEVGKYLREVLMARVVRFYRDEQPELADASGYHDPVTARFVEATALLREKRKVPARCFER
mgnify:CR=1 FL=1